jgi:hypothetical protein
MWRRCSPHSDCRFPGSLSWANGKPGAHPLSGDKDAQRHYYDRASSRTILYFLRLRTSDAAGDDP